MSSAQAKHGALFKVGSHCVTRTLNVEEPGFSLTEIFLPLPSALPVLGLKVCTTLPLLNRRFSVMCSQNKD